MDGKHDMVQVIEQKEGDKSEYPEIERAVVLLLLPEIPVFQFQQTVFIHVTLLLVLLFHVYYTEFRQKMPNFFVTRKVP